MKYSGYDADLLVPEDYDLSLRARVERANTWCRQLGKKNVCLVSIHTNAASLYLPGHKLRKDYSDGDPDWESDFYILKNTLCAAALSENLFHDNPKDLAFLVSASGRQAIIGLHVRGIISFVNAYSK